MNKMKLIFHIGMQRTGTTFLQYTIFPHIEELNLVDFDRYNDKLVGNKEIKNILNNIENYDEDTIIKKIYSRFKQDKINLISNENIYCKMFTKDDKRFLKITTIKELFPDAKIIFGTRNKESSLVSWYIKYVMRGGTVSFQDYLEKIENIEKLNYEPYIEYLLNLFEKENIYIYKFEDLKKDVVSFVQGICNFIGVSAPSFQREKRNVAYTLNQLKLAMLFNRVFKTPMNPNGFIPLSEYYIPHRYVFQSRFFSNLKRKKITIEDLKRINI